MEDRHVRRRKFGALHSLGNDEHSLRRPRTLSRSACRHQRWPIGFRVSTARGPFHLHGVSRRAPGGRENQVPTAPSQVSPVKICLGNLDASLRRQTLAAQKSKGEKSERN